MINCKLLLFDLDGTLLRSDKTISPRTLHALMECRKQGILIGVSTSRSEQNALTFIRELQPDVLIASGGALVKYRGEYIYKAEFSAEETRQMIAAAREVCGGECEITIDTIDTHYWNYKIDPKKQDGSWGDSTYTDFVDFHESSLKMCVEIFDDGMAERLREELPECDCIRFSDGFWYKFTKKTATKENAICKIGAVCGIQAEEMTAFGDDYADIGMLQLCGRGIAMGNAIDEVKAQADLVIGSNDEDGIAAYLEKMGTITVRDARLADAGRLLEIYAYYVEHTAISFEYTVPTLLEFQSRMEKTMKRYPYLVIERDGIIQGYAYAGAFVGRAAYDWSCELTIYLDHTALRGGLGRKLYEALENRLKEMGILNLYACIGYPEKEDEYLNRNSAAFHEHLGFATVGTFHNCGHKFGRWYHMIWMEKIIGEHETFTHASSGTPLA